MNRNRSAITRITATLLLSITLLHISHAQQSLREFMPIYYESSYTSMGCEKQGITVHAQFRNEFCTREIMHKQLGINWCRGEHLWSNTLTHTGYVHYGRFRASSGYGHQFEKKLAITLRAVYELEHATHYPTRHSITIDCSGCLKIGNKTTLAIYLFNPIRMRYSIISNEIMPTIISLFCLYQPVEKLAFSGFAKLSLPFQPDIGVQLLWQPIPNLAVITHCSNTKTGLSILLHSKKMTFEMRTDWCYRTGISPEADFYYLH